MSGSLWVIFLLIAMVYLVEDYYDVQCLDVAGYENGAYHNGTVWCQVDETGRMEPIEDL